MILGVMNPGTAVLILIGMLVLFVMFLMASGIVSIRIVIEDNTKEKKELPEETEKKEDQDSKKSE